jgi:site-specific recombinase XerD
MNLKKQERFNYVRHDGIRDFVHQDAPGLHQCKFASIYRDFRNIFQRAGITPTLTFKHLRNTFCSNLVNSNTNLALVCKMTGHQNVTTLLRYLKPDWQSLQDGLARAFHHASEASGTINSTDGMPDWDDVLEEKQAYQ